MEAPYTERYVRCCERSVSKIITHFLLDLKVIIRSFMKKIKKVVIDSIAYHLGIKSGDYLLNINNNEIHDVFDYRYEIKNEFIEVLIKKENENIIYEIEKDLDEDLGI